MKEWDNEIRRQMGSHFYPKNQRIKHFPNVPNDMAAVIQTNWLAIFSVYFCTHCLLCSKIYCILNNGRNISIKRFQLESISICNNFRCVISLCVCKFPSRVLPVLNILLEDCGLSIRNNNFKEANALAKGFIRTRTWVCVNCLHIRIAQNRSIFRMIASQD